MRSTKESIVVKSYLGNTMSLKVNQLEDNKYSIEINDKGFILDVLEMNKVKEYLSNKMF